MLLELISISIKFQLDNKIMSLKLLVRSLSVIKYNKSRMFYRCLYTTKNSTINDPISGISLFQIKQILKQNHIVTVEGHACIIIECPICDSEKFKKSKIYINKTTGKRRYYKIYNKINIFDEEYMQISR